MAKSQDAWRGLLAGIVIGVIAVALFSCPPRRPEALFVAGSAPPFPSGGGLPAGARGPNGDASGLRANFAAPGAPSGGATGAKARNRLSPGAPIRAAESGGVERFDGARGAGGAIGASGAQGGAGAGGRETGRASPRHGRHPSRLFYAGLSSKDLVALAQQRLAGLSLSAACRSAGLETKCGEARRSCERSPECADWLSRDGASSASPREAGEAGEITDSLTKLPGIPIPKPMEFDLDTLFSSLPKDQRQALVAMCAKNDAFCEPVIACQLTGLYAQCLKACNAKPQCRGAIPDVPGLAAEGSPPDRCPGSGRELMHWEHCDHGVTRRPESIVPRRSPNNVCPTGGAESRVTFDADGTCGPNPGDIHSEAFVVCCE